MRLIGDKLACERGDRRVFTGLDFAVDAGDLVTLRGPNGSGKTSLIRMIAGLIDPVEGRLALEGGDAGRTIGQHCHLVGHHEALKPALSAAENLAFWAGFLGGGDVAAALAAFDLEPVGELQAALLSAGQRRRLALARLALVARPVWLLDEPTLGLDSASVDRLGQLMTAHLRGGGLIIAATHGAIGAGPERVVDLGSVAAGR